ncbi:mRNA-decapping enzyme subunit 2 [Sporothrix epigloea]|uniref:mRNA-decapping enzyme subunit 2 n=1 Tax=Sporothrix epigloea TaxID=1892477 RepID=A0ABP0DN74_9PEZI
MTSQKMRLEDWLDDLCVRFIVNLPQADLASMARICFQVEEAHWFYDDFIRPLDRSLPPMTLRTFCLAIFKRCPLLAPFPIENHVLAFEEFLKYKTSIPVRGAILLNEAMDMALLVKGWKKGANWSFPKGKINMDEDDLDCAIREVDEETGFDIRAAGLVPPPEDVKFIETTFRDQQIRLYVFRNVPMDTYFEPKTRKEIGGIQWYKIDDLPTYRKKGASTNGGHGNETDEPGHSSTNNKFYMVAQFTGQLKKWIAQQRKKDAIRAGKEYLVTQIALAEDPYTEDEGNTLPEAVQSPLTTSAAADPTQILANASRDLRQMLRIPPLSPEKAPPADPSIPDLADSNQNKASALLALLQKGAGVPPSGRSTDPGASLDHFPPQAQHDMRAPQPQHQLHPLQQAPYQDHPRHPPPGFHQPMPASSLPVQGQQVQPSPGYNQYEAPHPGPLQQQAYNKTPLAQQNQHLQQRFQLPHSHQGHRPPENSRQQGQQQPIHGHNANPFAPNFQGQAPLHMANGNHLQGQPQTQAQTQAQAAIAAFSPQQNPPAPIPLLHPQPLPPVVQKALFARELLASPDVAGQQNNALLPPPPPPIQHSRGQQPPLSSHAAALLSAFKKNAAPQTGPPVAPGGPNWPQQPQNQSHVQSQPQPHRHASHDVSAKPPQQQQQQQHFATLPHNHMLHGARPQPPPHQQPYTAQQAGPVREQPSLANGANSSVGKNVYGTINAPPVANNALQTQLLGRLTKHSDQHINSLLGMFNKQAATTSQAAAPTAASTAASAAASSFSPNQNMKPQQAVGTTQGITTHQTMCSATTISTAQGVGEPSQARALEATAIANGGPVEMKADLNLPFGALSLLTRLKSQEGSGIHARSDAADRSQHPSTFSTPIVELPASTARVPAQVPVVSPVMQVHSSLSSINRQQEDITGERRPSTQGAQRQQQPHGSTFAANSTLSMNSIGSRRPSQTSPSTAPMESALFAHGGAHTQHQQQVNLPGPEKHTEHAQKLLSLFSRPPQVSPGAARNPSMLPHAPPLPGSSRSSMDRANGLAATDAPHMPPTDGLPSNTLRRGSQTPITPANRSFLLGYLASVSGMK